ncbi:uncharacterized protein LOC115748913 [Rhodamnia argentea]|uniref:Uncharacterized protein LOC115748913 n=1 Tax=Rhodamnia argentea TaxID=178133 RepID=A0A8B8Q4I5_9MYRT|nr:uncharacterized protein LOC115748913 [Rhodamnia argentea]
MGQQNLRPWNPDLVAELVMRQLGAERAVPLSLLFSPFSVISRSCRAPARHCLTTLLEKPPRCETLVEFHIGCLHNFRVPSLVSLPNLKVLTLDDVGFGDSLEKLLSLPSLEEVSLKACRFHEIKVLNIGAPNLLKFFMTDLPKDFSRRGQVRIHAARIKSLRYFGPYDRNLNISCPSSLVEAVIVAFQAQEQPDQYANHVFKLLKELSNIEHLTLYLDRLQVMDERKDLLDSCPVFLSLTQLKWYISPMYLGLSVLQIMLSQCPCLRSLVFVFCENG